MEHIHIFYAPAYADTMDAVQQTGIGMSIDDPGAMLFRLNQTSIKKILKLLVNNDVSTLENVRAFDECLVAEATDAGLFDVDRTVPLSSYGKKLAAIMKWWDAELDKRGVLLHCGDIIDS